MNKQKGFSLAIVLLSLLLVLGIGFTGYYVWNSQNSKKDNIAEVAPATATKQESNKTEASVPPKEEQKYLVIKEWGVKIPVDEQYSDLIINRYCENDVNFCAFVFSPTQIKLAKNVGAICHSPENMNNLGSVVRYKDPNIQYMGTTMGSAFSPNKKVGDWYYGYKMPTEATCMMNGSNYNSNELTDYYSQFEKNIINYIANTQNL